AKKLLAKSLLTLSHVLAGTGEYTNCFINLDHAQALGEFLGDRDLVFEVQKQRKTVAQEYADVTHRQLVILALELANHSVRNAAKLIGCSHNPLDRYIKLHKIQRHRKVLKSVISKPQK